MFFVADGFDDPGFSDPGFGDPVGDGLWSIFPVIFVLVLVVGIVIAIMNFKKATDAGVNPFTMETEALTTVINSQALAAEKPVEERLAHLDDLKARGVITEAEHAAARLEVIKDL